jgi:hypothetical protein
MTATSSSVDAISITLEYPPEVFIIVKVKFVATGNSSAVNLPTIFPESFMISNKTFNNNQYMSTIISNDPGQFQIKLEILGFSRSEYNIIYPVSNVISVLGNDQPPPIPQIQSLIYSDDATYIILKFDSETNKGNLDNFFTCSSIFNFTGSSLSSCQWIDSSTVNIFVNPNVPFPKSIIVLSLNKIKALCNK